MWDIYVILLTTDTNCKAWSVGFPSKGVQRFSRMHISGIELGSPYVMGTRAAPCVAKRLPSGSWSWREVALWSVSDRWCVRRQFRRSPCLFKFDGFPLEHPSYFPAVSLRTNHATPKPDLVVVVWRSHERTSLERHTAEECPSCGNFCNFHIKTDRYVWDSGLVHTRDILIWIVGGSPWLEQDDINHDCGVVDY